MEPVGVGLVGSGFVGDIHAQAYRMIPEAEVRAVASPTAGHARALADRHGIPRAETDWREILTLEGVEVIDVCAPNFAHCEIVCAAAEAGKHAICEKPLCLTLEEADRMIEACRGAGVHLFYAEELLFAPKYLRAKTLVDEGAIGRPFLVKQGEEHDGPHADWFWDVERSGGGVLLDMGCHSVEFGRWIFGKKRPVAVLARLGTHLHRDRTAGEDHSICLVEYEGGEVAVAENSWAKRGGVDDRAEIYGSEGFTRADLLRGSALLTFSERGYGYAVEKAATTRGYSFTMFEEIWNYGFPQELAHFMRCVRGLQSPIETGVDGRVVLEILYAAYASAGLGRRVELPYRPARPVSKPIDLWKEPQG